MIRKDRYALIYSVLLAILLSFSLGSFSEGTELIPDGHLLEAVSDQLGLSGEEITPYNMLDLVSLTASGVKDLSGISHAENLERLRLENLDYFVETDPLSELENLEVLEIVRSSVETEDLEGLEALEDLEILRLTDNRIGDIFFLGDLTSIKELYLANNEVVELEGIERLEDLQVLDLSGNHLISTEPLVGLKNLDYLDLSGNQLKSVKPLLKNEGLDKGDVIHIHNNLLDFSPNSENIQNVKALKSRGIQVTCLPQRTQVKVSGQKDN